MSSAYSYTVLRYVHDTTTGEFVNVGVVLYSPAFKYASALCRPTYARLTGLFPGVDGEAFKRLMKLVQARLEELGAKSWDELPLEGKPDSVMTLVHQVLPADDSSLQWSSPGGGVTDNPAATLEKLFDRLVAFYDERPERPRRKDEDVWRTYKRTLEARNVLKHLESKTITGADDEVEFPYAWKNGVWHCFEPLSFDLASADGIRAKAHSVLGRMMSVRDAPEEFKVYLLLGEPQNADLRPAYLRARNILNKLPVEHQLVLEQDAAAFGEILAAQVDVHDQKEGRASEGLDITDRVEARSRDA